jgi:hypothetical protein
MRVPAALLAFAVAIPTVATAAAVETGKTSAPSQASACPTTTSHFAASAGLYRGPPLTPKKLNQLPPATTYMAVYRHIGRCEAPLTMVEYRNTRRR